LVLFVTVHIVKPVNHASIILQVTSDLDIKSFISSIDIIAGRLLVKPPPSRLLVSSVITAGPCQFDF
jgi:hypothetical protein